MAHHARARYAAHRLHGSCRPWRNHQPRAGRRRSCGCAGAGAEHGAPRGARFSGVAACCGPLLLPLPLLLVTLPLPLSFAGLACSRRGSWLVTACCARPQALPGRLQRGRQQRGAAPRCWRPLPATDAATALHHCRGNSWIIDPGPYRCELPGRTGVQICARPARAGATPLCCFKPWGLQNTFRG